MTEPTDPILCDRFELARIFEVSADTIRSWQRGGCPSLDPTPKEKRRLYRPAAVHNWLLTRALRRERYGY